jgi:hypothetical protein
MQEDCPGDDLKDRRKSASFGGGASPASSGCDVRRTPSFVRRRTGLPGLGARQGATYPRRARTRAPGTSTDTAIDRQAPGSARPAGGT